MPQDNTTFNVMLAGASGLIGSQLLPLLIQNTSIAHVHLLTRKLVNESSDKISQHVSDTLQLSGNFEKKLQIDIGYICLGTTRKQAGSNENLFKVDVELVTRVATLMRNLGAKQIVVVSSIGAKSSSWSHYLRCKGLMESNIIKLNFDKVLFLRPGPLVGIRKQPRKDEIILQKVMSILSRFMFGYLTNLIPINAALVASCMFKRSLANTFVKNENNLSNQENLRFPVVEYIDSNQIYNEQTLVEKQGR